jgi:uncharacterized protein (TIGR00369 family)
MKSLQETYGGHSRCFGCGPENEKGLRLRSFPEGEGAVATWQAEPHHEAFPGILNGGIIAALLDCHGAWTATWALMRAAGTETPPDVVTADLHVAYKRPAPSTEPVTLRARPVEQGQDWVIVEVTLEASGKVRASGRGKFVSVKQNHPAATGG